MEDLNHTAVEVFDKYADLYQQRFMDVGLYHDSLDRFCAAIAAENPAVLELACGPGNITRYLLQRRPDLRILGTDLAPNMVALARHNNPQATFELMDSRKIALLSQRYHALMAGFLLPYLSKVAALQLIADAAKILQPGGVLYLSTMEDDYTKSGFKRNSQGDEVFMYFHEAGYLSESLSENGFELDYLHRVQYPGADGALVTDLLIIGILKEK